MTRSDAVSLRAADETGLRIDPPRVSFDRSTEFDVLSPI
jgi:hypothetical protein